MTDELKPSTCTVCLPWGFSDASDSARKKHCRLCAGTGLVYAVPTTHRVVSVELLDSAVVASYLSCPEISQSLNAIIEDKP